MPKYNLMPNHKFYKSYPWHNCHGYPFHPVYRTEHNPQRYYARVHVNQHKYHSYNANTGKFIIRQPAPIIYRQQYMKPYIAAKHTMNSNQQSAANLWINYAVKWLKDYGIEPTSDRVIALIKNYAPNLEINKELLTPEKLYSTQKISSHKLNNSAWPNWLKQVNTKAIIPEPMAEVPPTFINTPSSKKVDIDLNELIDISAGVGRQELERVTKKAMLDAATTKPRPLHQPLREAHEKHIADIKPESNEKPKHNNLGSRQPKK